MPNPSVIVKREMDPVKFQRFKKHRNELKALGMAPQGAFYKALVLCGCPKSIIEQFAPTHQGLYRSAESGNYHSAWLELDKAAKLEADKLTHERRKQRWRKDNMDHQENVRAREELEAKILAATSSDVDFGADLVEAYQLWPVEGLQSENFKRPGAFKLYETLWNSDRLRDDLLKLLANKELKGGFGVETDDGEVVEDSGLGDLAALAKELSG